MKQILSIESVKNNLFCKLLDKIIDKINYCLINENLMDFEIEFPLTEAESYFFKGDFLYKHIEEMMKKESYNAEVKRALNLNKDTFKARIILSFF